MDRNHLSQRGGRGRTQVLYRKAIDPSAHKGPSGYRGHLFRVRGHRRRQDRTQNSRGSQYGREPSESQTRLPSTLRFNEHVPRQDRRYRPIGGGYCGDS